MLEIKALGVVTMLIFGGDNFIDNFLAWHPLDL